MKKNIFVNFTNHPSKNWSAEQMKAAKQYGQIVDVPFPDVDETGDETYIENLAMQNIEIILQYQPIYVLCQGEFSLAYQVVKMLKERGVIVLTACSKRLVCETSNCKEVVFQFSRFRQY